MSLKIAMWSGPRNLSTAMMRAFENRPDCVVWDEPLYGPYLHCTGKPHPGAADVIAAQGSDWRRVVEMIGGPVPGGHALWYQKHMTHHILPGMSLDWIDSLTNCFLIRHPAEVLASYSARRESFDAHDLGFPMQLELFRRVLDRAGNVPPVLDSADVLRDPRGMLDALCRCLGIDFDERMLSWPPGPRDSDGVWARYWYDSVLASTGFAAPTTRKTRLDAHGRRVVEDCMPAYQALFEHRLRSA